MPTITKETILADSEKHLGLGLHKHCSCSGCGYDESGKCRVFGGRVCMAHTNEVNRLKEIAGADNPFYVKAEERKRAERIFLEVMTEGVDDGLA